MSLARTYWGILSSSFEIRGNTTLPRSAYGLRGLGGVLPPISQDSDGIPQYVLARLTVFSQCIKQFFTCNAGPDRLLPRTKSCKAPQQDSRTRHWFEVRFVCNSCTISIKYLSMVLVGSLTKEFQMAVIDCWILGVGSNWYLFFKIILKLESSWNKTKDHFGPWARENCLMQ